MDSEKLLYNMPDYYKTSDLTKSILEAIASEYSRYLENCEYTKNEINVFSASKTLDKYERDFKIPIDNSYPDEYRISNILAKLRGQGIITVQRIKDIAEAYSNGEVEISKIPSQYTLIITFVGTKGIPPNLEDLKEVLNKLKAADWVIEYKFSYLTWNERDGYDYTWDEWDALDLTWDQYETYKK